MLIQHQSRQKFITCNGRFSGLDMIVGKLTESLGRAQIMLYGLFNKLKALHLMEKLVPLHEML